MRSGDPVTLSNKLTEKHRRLDAKNYAANKLTIDDIESVSMCSFGFVNKYYIFSVIMAVVIYFGLFNVGSS